MYKILPYSYNKAKKLKVKIYPSNKKNKKIDVYTLDNRYIVSIGQRGYLDYPYYLKLFGKKIADSRKKQYKIRHKKDMSVKYSAGYYASKILW